jgi:hypothetical protein
MPRWRTTPPRLAAAQQTWFELSSLRDRNLGQPHGSPVSGCDVPPRTSTPRSRRPGRPRSAARRGRAGASGRAAARIAGAGRTETLSMLPSDSGRRLRTRTPRRTVASAGLSAPLPIGVRARLDSTGGCRHCAAAPRPPTTRSAGCRPLEQQRSTGLSGLNATSPRSRTRWPGWTRARSGARRGLRGGGGRSRRPGGTARQAAGRSGDRRA